MATKMGETDEDVKKNPQYPDGYAEVIGDKCKECGFTGGIHSGGCPEFLSRVDEKIDVSDRPLAVSDEENRKFETGAVRDSASGKGTPVLISPYMIDRLSKHLEKGADKYTPRNWEKGIPLSENMNSLLRHVNAMVMGKDDEDHCAAALCNLMFYLHIKEMIDRGILPKSLDDMPYHEKQKPL